MALGTPTIVSRRNTDKGGADILLQFAGDGAYPAGGTAAFQAFVRTAVAAAAAAAADANVRGAQNLEVISVNSQDCGVYSATYDKAADKLKVWDQANVENATGDISGTTFNLIVQCK
jgi:hypothetical protein